MSSVRMTMPCTLCDKPIKLEALDLLVFGGKPKKLTHNECLGLPKKGKRQ